MFKKCLGLPYLIVLLITIPLEPLWAIPTQGSQIMISGPSAYAVAAGKEIAKKGGNVVDVAVTMGFTLAVTSPYYAGLGGGGFALVGINKKVDVLDFREVAPKKTSPEFYLTKKKDASTVGGTAVGVPGVPAGLWALHKKYGKLPWSQLLKTPIQLAQNGFQVSGEWVSRTTKASTKFNKGGKTAFLKKKGELYKPGEVIKQRALAKVLKEMRSRNIASFYKGIVARDIVDTVQRSGGVIELSDLRDYKVRWLEPLTTQFKGHKLYLMPPPSSGGVVIKTALNLIDRLELEKQPPLGVEELHLMGEILSRSFRGRSLLGDPDFHNNPLALLHSEKFLKKMAKSIDDDETEDLEPLTEVQLKESTETTHFSILDAKGNAVSLTVTLNGNYGSGVVSDRFGIALNNEMDDFTTRPNEPNMFGLVQGKGNVVQPGKRPLSSMSPTLVEKNGQVMMAIGAPGGPRIISSVLQVIYRSLVTGWDMDLAIQSPRVHHQFLPHTLFIDKNRFSPEVVEGLKDKDHKVVESWMGRVYAVKKNANGILEAAYDSRGEGAAGGL